MRIGYLTYGLDRAPTGIGRYAAELLRGLAALPDGPEIVLLTTERERLAEWDALERYTLPGCRLLPALMTLGNAAVSSAIRRYQLDLVHDPNGIAPFLGPRGRARRVVTIHDAFAYVCPEAHNRLDTWRYHHMLPRAARSADQVLTDSAHSARDIARYLAVPAQRLRVVPLGIDRRFSPIAAGAGRDATLARYGISFPYLLYVGGLNARKNIARLLEAYDRVQTRHPAIRLVLGGKRQWQTAEIDAALQRLELADRVHFTGYVDDRDLPALYSAATAFVFPSLYEGFGLPPLEAMACGTPVVTANVSSLPEVVGNAALTVDPYDVDALAAAIDRLLSSPALAAELRARGQARAREYTWERTARATWELYQEVVAQPAGSVAVEGC